MGQDRLTVAYAMAMQSLMWSHIQVYQAKNDGQPISPPVRSKLCGTTPPTSYTTTSQTIVVHLHVEAPPPTTAVSTVTQTTDATTQPTGASAEPVTSEPELGPFINFTADFTSYFIGECGPQSDRPGKVGMGTCQTCCKFVVC